MIKINFRIDTRYGLFSDALNLPDDHGLTDQEIEAMKQKRADDWVAYLDRPPEQITVDTTHG